MTKEFIREEKDGSTTKEYYSYGVNISKEVWEKKSKLS